MNENVLGLLIEFPSTDSHHVQIQKNIHYQYHLNSFFYRYNFVTITC